MTDIFNFFRFSSKEENVESPKFNSSIDNISKEMLDEYLEDEEDSSDEIVILAEAVIDPFEATSNPVEEKTTVPNSRVE